jgi:hypothetical protein
MSEIKRATISCGGPLKEVQLITLYSSPSPVLDSVNRREDQDSHGHLKGREQQGEECDVGHDHRGPQFAGGSEKGSAAEPFVNVIVR